MQDRLEVVVADAFRKGMQFGSLQMRLGTVGIQLLSGEIRGLIADLGKNAVTIRTVDLVQLHAAVEVGRHDPFVVL